MSGLKPGPISEAKDKIQRFWLRQNDEQRAKAKNKNKSKDKSKAKDKSRSRSPAFGEG